jgi:hypothetical protein
MGGEDGLAVFVEDGKGRARDEIINGDPPCCSCQIFCGENQEG